MTACSICYEKDNYLFELPCGDEDCCMICLNRYIREQINQGGYKIVCPTYECSEKIPYQTATMLIDDDLVEKLDRNIVRHADLDLEKGRNVICPNCKETCEFDDDDDDKVRCENCGTRFCKNCFEEYYDSYHECELIGSLADALDLVQKELKRCPKCANMLYKGEGCDSMKCPICRVRFCMDCMEIVPKGEIRDHNETCNGFDGYDTSEFDSESTSESDSEFEVEAESDSDSFDSESKPNWWRFW